MHCLNFPSVGWPHWRKQWDCGQLPDRRGSLGVSGASTPTKAEWNFPPSSTVYPQQNKRQIFFFPASLGHFEPVEKKRNTYKLCEKNICRMMWGCKALASDATFIKNEKEKRCPNLALIILQSLNSCDKRTQNVDHWNVGSTGKTLKHNSSLSNL